MQGNVDVRMPCLFCTTVNKVIYCGFGNSSAIAGDTSVKYRFLGGKYTKFSVFSAKDSQAFVQQLIQIRQVPVKSLRRMIIMMIIIQQ